MTPGIYNFENHYKGDTFDSVEFGLTEAGAALDLTDAAITVQFRKSSETGVVVKTMTIGNGITIIGATTEGKFSIDSFLNDWAIGTYYYDIQVVFINGVHRTYLKGTLVVTQDTTVV